MPAARKNSTKRLFPALLAGLAVLVIIGVGLSKHFLKDDTPVKNAPTSNAVNSNEPESKIDYSPGTPEDNATTKQSKESDKPFEDNSGNTTSGAQVTLTNVNTGSDPIHVGTLVSGATSGTCVATFTPSGGGNSVTVSSSVSQQVNGQYSCGALNADKSKFSTGSYDIYVSLGGSKSNTLSGVSLK